MSNERKVVPIGERPRKRKPANDPLDRPPPPSWLILNGNGQPTKGVANVLAVLAHDDRWRGVLAFDERRGGPCFRTEPPWHADYSDGVTTIPRAVVDGDAVRLAAWLEREFGLAVSPRTSSPALDVAASCNRVDDVRTYLEGLRWDGKARATKWLIDYAGAEDTPYVCAVGPRWLMSAVARIYEPGCQVDTAVVFEGDQGSGKTSLIRALCPDPTWHVEHVGALTDKDSLAILQGPWIVELSELAALERTALEATKSYISRRDDVYRAVYSHRHERHPRRVVFAGSTNAECYLRDETGGRRWWPVSCRAIDVGALVRDRDQLWAEAVRRYRAREPWYLDTAELRGLAQEETEQRYAGDPWESSVASWVAAQTAGFLPTATILEGAIGMKPDKQDQGASTRIGKIMRKIEGWRHKQLRQGAARVRGYVRCAG